ncbi:MAG TPA: type I DNA topoisomerase [Candidatus Portnoybacteria bacterium]|nr:type I DNA topoisomerase [Candidatus Portnoybacteria bacterium]
MNLVIVESPTKAKTIQRFLPAGFTVRSSYGHIRDLPRQKLGVNVDNNFEPQYTVTLIARKKLADIKKLLSKTDKVILATDEDREGEAIAWHLTYALKLNAKETERIVFHEITKPAIAQAIKSPRAIDMNLVNAQQARRILDRLVGYKLSPFLWRKVAKGLSAGRVQSVAVRLIVERERAIAAFKADEYWSIEALLKKSDNPLEFSATLIKENDKPISKLDIKNEAEAKKIVQDLTGAQYKATNLSQKEVNRYPSPPFVTSTLQQDAVNKLYFSAKQTMQIAQQLYEGISLGQEGSVGLITYMRTDSVSLAKEAVEQIRGYIKEEFGQNYLPPAARIYKTKSKGAQEAHEAIRPTDISYDPEKIKAYLTPHQYKLYKLIWRRALACQMASAVLSTTAVDISAKHYLFRATGSQIKFDGFLKIYNGKTQEIILPPLTKDELLELLKLNPNQHFTQPPARFSEAALIKALEELGIGRPSTYAPTISTILDRNYVQKNPEKKFMPTDIGCQVNDLLVEHFPEIVDWQFTANMEEQLDKIAEGKLAWVPVIREFYVPFSEHLAQKYQDVAKQKPEPEMTDKICPQCQAPLLIRTSRFGKFYACSKFPACRYTENIAQELGVGCPKCFEGQIIAKRTKRGKIFYACSRYPKCDFALWNKPTGAKCPQCGALLVAAKNGTKCSNKECDYKEKNQPVE